MKRCLAIMFVVGIVALLPGLSSPASAQARTEGVFNGHKIIIPESSVPRPGRHHTNYFFVDTDQPQKTPPGGVELPAPWPASIN